MIDREKSKGIMKGSEIAIALNEWFDSYEGKICLGDSILESERDVVYLRNRLRNAFLAGVAAAEKLISQGDDHAEI